MRNLFPLLLVLLLGSIIGGILYQADRCDRLNRKPQIEETYWKIRYEPYTQQERDKVAELTVQMKKARFTFGDESEMAKKIVCEPRQWEYSSSVFGPQYTGKTRPIVQ